MRITITPADLETLEDLWLEKLEPYGDKGYNERKEDPRRTFADDRGEPKDLIGETLMSAFS